MPNPAAHPGVKRYLKGVTEEQLKALTIPKQAEPIFICDLTALCQVIDSKLLWYYEEVVNTADIISHTQENVLGTFL